MLLRPADSRRNPRQRQRGQGSTSLLSTAMRATSSRQRRQVSGNLHRANSVASQSPWPHDADVNPQATRTPASVYGQLTLPQPQFSASPAASTEGNAQVQAQVLYVYILKLPDELCWRRCDWLYRNITGSCWLVIAGQKQISSTIAHLHCGACCFCNVKWVLPQQTFRLPGILRPRQPAVDAGFCGRDPQCSGAHAQSPNGRGGWCWAISRAG